MYGDFEAQRHWVEVTTALPLSAWYVNGPKNNLTYWGLDYPPLTAYHSLLLGCVASLRMSTQQFNASFGLVTSHGSETPATVGFMRETVLWSELFVFFPAAIATAFLLCVEMDPWHWRGTAAPAAAVTADKKPRNQGNAKTPNQQPTVAPRRSTLVFAVIILLNGSLPMILIDHAHFQYNSVSLGLMLWSVFHAGKHITSFERWTALSDCSKSTFRTPPAESMIFLLRHLLLSVVFAALSMSFKQMSLYYSIGLGCWYLGECVRYSAWRASRVGNSSPVFAGCFVAAILACAVAGLGVFAVVLSPFYWSGTLADVTSRVFPVGRGLYEDKVANVWCSASPVLKLPALAAALGRQLASSVEEAPEVSRRIILACCLLSTIAGCSVSCWRVLKDSATKYTTLSGTKPTDTSGEGIWAMSQMVARRSQKRMESLLWCLLCSSLSFFLFSFQVHEKSILLPLLPATVLLALLQSRLEWEDSAHREGVLNCRALLWVFVLFAHLSLFQLAEKDKVVLCFTVMAFFLTWQARRACRTNATAAIDRTSERSRWFTRIILASTTMEVIRITLLEGHERYPHLGVLARMAMCTVVFLVVLWRGTVLTSL